VKSVLDHKQLKLALPVSRRPLVHMPVFGMSHSKNQAFGPLHWIAAINPAPYHSR